MYDVCGDTLAVGLMQRSEDSFVDLVFVSDLYVGSANLIQVHQVYVANDLLAELFCQPRI